MAKELDRTAILYFFFAALSIVASSRVLAPSESRKISEERTFNKKNEDPH
jgi:hypothetical protein